MSTTEKNHPLTQFGFRFERGGPHNSRTMMLDELRCLLAYVDRPDAEQCHYLQAITEQNCLGKRSEKTRFLSRRYLVELYSLDPAKVLFRSLVYFWKRDHAAQPLLAQLCTYVRDPLFRSTAPPLLAIPEGTIVISESFEEFVDKQKPGRFSKVTLQSTARNIAATWTKSGHLCGKTRKVRTRVLPTSASVAYALLIGYLAGARGQTLFQTEYMKLLDCEPHQALELAQQAAAKGWLVLKHLGDVVEVLFPNLITQEEMEWLREQN